MNQFQFLLLCLAGWINRNQQNVIEYLQEEVKVLKEQLGRQPRFNDAQRRRLAAKAKQIGLKHLQGIATLATPRTLLDWHHRLVAGKYDSFGQRSPWRPPTAPELRALILRMAAENRTWGYTRIQGALQNLGHEIGRGTIAKILQEAGVDPTPDRQKRTTWKEFLRTHWDVLAAADFFSVEVCTALGLVRYHVFFVMRLVLNCIDKRYKIGNLGACQEKRVPSLVALKIDKNWNGWLPAEPNPNKWWTDPALYWAA